MIEINKLMQIIYLEWVDAMSRDAWLDIEEVEKWADEKAVSIKTIGFLLKENKDFITVIQNYNIDSCSMVMKIPKAWILKKKLIK